MTMLQAQERAAEVLRTQYPTPYDHVQVHGDGPDAYYVMGRRHDDHTAWVRV